MTGKDFRALVRLSDKEDRTLAEVGETCERLPASTRWDLFVASQLIAPVQAGAVVSAPADPEPADEPDDHDGEVTA